MTASWRHRGFSLFEMLAALVVLALATGLVASRISPPSASERLDQAAELLADDLRRAQLQARRSAAAVLVAVTETGYHIDALSVGRDWPAGLNARWLSRTRFGWQETETLNMSGRPLSREGARIVIRLEAVERIVRLDAISGQIHVDRSMQ